jgi:hypothetical protein
LGPLITLRRDIIAGAARFAVLRTRLILVAALAAALALWVFEFWGGISCFLVFGSLSYGRTKAQFWIYDLGNAQNNKIKTFDQSICFT